MPTLLGANTLSSGYDVANSCRFNADAYMVKDIVTPTNQKKYTISVWVKRSKLTSRQRIFTVIDTSSTAAYSYLEFQSDDKLNFDDFDGSSTRLTRTTNAVFRDPSAWMNIIIAVDTTQSTGSNRVKMYINGTQVSSFGTETNASQNFDTTTLNSNKTFRVGEHGTAGFRFAGYMCEFVLIDGSQLDQTSFGEFDSDTPTLWKPIDVSGLTFGNNGFYLDFEDSSNLGNDVNGGTDLTETSLAATDQSTDTCTNNFMTLSPLLKGSNIDLTEGNVVNTGNTNSDAGNVACTFPIAFSGKWYFEMKITAISAAGYPKFAVFHDFESVSQGNYNGGSGGNNMHPTESIATVLQYTSTTLGNPNSNLTITAPANGNIFQFALDMDNGAIYVGVNGTYYNSGDPTSGSSKTGKIADLTVTNQIMPMSSNFNGSATAYNFGATPGFSISSGNADANGHGNFEYAPPSGYFALCSKNIGEFG